MRYLSTVWASTEDADALAIYIPLTTPVAIDLLPFRETVRQINKKHSSHTIIEFDDCTPFLLEKWQEESERFEILEDEVNSSDILDCPDFFDIDKSKIIRCTDFVARAYGDGVHWKMRPRYTDYTIETSDFRWELIEEIANDPKPKSNAIRKHCWWCGDNTVERMLFTSREMACQRCNK